MSVGRRKHPLHGLALAVIKQKAAAMKQAGNAAFELGISLAVPWVAFEPVVCAGRNIERDVYKL